MAEFHMSLARGEVAKQIADMVNQHNKWITTFTGRAIAMTAAHYFVELHGSKVVGCAGYLQDFVTLTKIQHICVLPEYRRRGIARKLTEMAIWAARTEYVYMTIRSDNTPSLELASSLGFKYITKNWFRDHWTLTLGRRRKECPQSIQQMGKN